MRVISLHNGFGLHNLELLQVPEPAPARGQLLLRMRAASLNYRDYLMVTGQYNPRQPLPLVPCSDGVGEVVGVGDDVSGFSVGARVCPIFAQGWLSDDPTRELFKSTLGGPLGGTLTEYMLVPASAVVAVPEHLSDAEAACLPCAWLTAYNAVITQGRLLPGDVLVTQGTGGVALAALSFGKLVGARVIAMTSKAQRVPRLQELGAELVIDYKANPEWSGAVRSFTGGRGADHVVDVAGAASLAQSLRAVRPGGTVSVIGNLGGSKTEVDLLALLMQNVRLQGVFVGSRRDFVAMNRALSAARCAPIVDRTFELEDARAAFEYLAQGAHFGKVCIRISAGVT